MDKYIGKKLEGRYEILELVGFGGMAIVYRAFDILEKKHVAVKILKDEFIQNDDFKRRFRNESKAIALLSHPGIVKVLDVNFSDNIQYIVMEYIDGITLKEYIEQQGSVKWKEAVHFTVQILRALQHAHDNGIVHRDVKPQNVMLLEDGTIKVMDFGIARFARENGKTMSDKAIGSVHYISPEQAQGDNTDERTDIYAVGVILYEMLTGTVPFDGDTAVSIAIKQMQMEPKNPTLIKPDIPLGLEEIILRAMQKDPQLRYQTAAEMLRDIDEFKRNPTVVFEYKYFNKDGTTKYFNKIESSKLSSGMIEKEQPRRSYTMTILAGVTVACVFLALVALYFFFKGLDNKPSSIVMPNLVGLSVAQAQTDAPDIVIKIIEEKPSVEYDKGIIIEQKTKANTMVKPNYELSVVVSSGLEALNMPELINETAPIAKSKLNAMGINNIEVIDKVDATIPLGRVVQTSPEAGAEVKKDDNVILFVSAGAADIPIRVPSLLGKTEVEARNELLRVGLILGTITAVDSEEPKNAIISQSIEPEQKAEKGTKIDIIISNGVPPLEEEVTGTSINIVFPAGVENKDVSFEIYVNLVSIDTVVLNPVTTPSLFFEFYLSDGLINDNAAVAEINNVVIGLPNGQFAQYTIDFATNKVVNVTKPDFKLLYPGGVAPSSTEEIRIPVE